MNSEILPFWELVLDGIQIIVCVLIFSFLIHTKIKYKRWILTTLPPKRATAFSAEMQIQHLRQLTEKCFDSVVNTIHQERLTLQSHFDGDISLTEKTGSVSPVSGSGGSVVPDFTSVLQGEPKPPGDTGFNNFTEIISLADKGLSIREISQQLNMPSGEVELVVRLNKEDVDDKHRRMLRAKA